MKKTITTAALCLSAAAFMASCKSGGASEIGKWDVTDSASADQHMVMEFTADGTMNVTSKVMEPAVAKYTRSGDKLMATDSKTGQKDTMTIVSNDGKMMTISGTSNGVVSSMTMKKEN